MENTTALDLHHVPHDTSSSNHQYDDDGRLKRTGTIWTTSAHIITAVVGSGVLSLGWAMAQLGWVIGPIVMLLFSLVTYNASLLLAAGYRTGDSGTGKRNYTFMEAVQSNLGGFQVKLCGVIQYVNLFGTAVGYTIASAVSMVEIQKSNCFHAKGHNYPCKASTNLYTIAFGLVEIVLSQIPDFDQIWWLSILAALMSFAYSFIGLALGIGKVIKIRKFKGSLSGVASSNVITSEKTWRAFQALGAIAFAYSYSSILIEIQDTIRSPPSEYKTMKKATLISIAITTVFYMLCGCFGFAAFGDSSPGNLLTGFYDPYWLVDIANVAIVIHLIGAYQVYSQPLFAFVEKTTTKWFPNRSFIVKEVRIRIPVFKATYKMNLFRLVWRTVFVIVTTLISIVIPFFNDVVGFLGAIGFWPLTVYFPVEIYISKKKIGKWSLTWMYLQTVSLVCLVVSVAAAVGSVAGIVNKLLNPSDTDS